MNRFLVTGFQIVVIGAAVALAGCSGKKVITESVPPTDSDSRIIEHVVAAGETLERIADNYFGDPG